MMAVDMDYSDESWVISTHSPEVVFDSQPSPGVDWAGRFENFTGAVDEITTLEDVYKTLAVKVADGLLVDYLEWYTGSAAHDPGDALIQRTDEDPLCAPHLGWMCRQIIENQDQWPSARMHRWVGFVQAGFIHNDVVTLEGERERIRNLSKELLGVDD